MVDLSVIIVNYNNFRVLRGCLPSLVRALEGLEAEVIVSDNGSTDGSLAWITETFPDFRILENKANLGFAEANNRAFALTDGRHVLLLNPDTVVVNDAFGAMMDVLKENPAAGAVGCRLLNGDGDVPAFNRTYDAFEATATDSASAETLRAWWLRRMIHTPHPLLEKMTLFWHGHFAISNARVKNALLIRRHVQLLRRHALGCFPPLLEAV